MSKTNRVTQSIQTIDEILAGTDDQQRDTLSKAATLDQWEWTLLGSLASRGLAEGTLDNEEAQLMHDIHGRFQSTATTAERMAFFWIAANVVCKDGVPAHTMN